MPEIVSLNPDSPKFEIKRLNDSPPGEAITCLIWGASKTGKTDFCGSAGSRTLFVNIGRGIETLYSPGFRKRRGIVNPYVVDVMEKMGERGIFDEAVAYDIVCDIIDYFIKYKRDEIDTVVIDDVTQLRKAAMHKALETSGALGKSKTLKNVVEKFNALLPAVQDYNVEMSFIEQFVSGYTIICKNAGLHFIMTAHERYSFEQQKNIGDVPVIRKISPGFTGRTFPDEVTGHFDWILHSIAVGAGDNTVYRVETKGSEKVTAGVRHDGVFKQTENNPDFLKMVQRVREASK